MKPALGAARRQWKQDQEYNNYQWNEGDPKQGKSIFNMFSDAIQAGTKTYNSSKTDSKKKTDKQTTRKQNNK